MESRKTKDLLFEQVARVGKAVASPKRLELLELLSQGEKTVEVLATEVSIDIKLASAHLKVLREARLVEARREGRFIAYRLSGDDIISLWLNLRSVAEKHLVELRVALDEIFSAPERLTAESRASLLEKARQGEVIVIDVRPEVEYRVGHLPFSRSLPLAEIERRLAELPPGKEVVAYCRGPFCLLSDEAVKLLCERGFRARKISDGVAEWAAEGLPVEVLAEA
ncbi:MAG: ArsR family transcriptional regulator [Desulfuromonadales bacterium GWC2_61_20]|nr:MAG: ArsR family transcriptional regulator [Desulfuromonadales bacterium GWC2_61_20]HAD05460.1 ArsR family transcriptional regulator [Desulfuromonas sp.]HBT82286.1 ArsR family transcriptional regulator [Desulfuromonas sp.]